ncbi:MAG: GldG family protein, partial [Deltaproteobacteria bacterium]|nr:GldG family protein [Deltaproteobacteria bacterium]
MTRRPPFGPAAAALLALSLAAWLLFPQLVGLWLLPLAAGLLLLLARGPARLAADLEAWRRRSGRRHLGAASRLLLAAALALAAGSLTRLPLFNLAAPPEATLPPETVRLLAKLPGPTRIEVRLADPSQKGPLEHLLALYAKASNLITFAVRPAEGQTETVDGEIRLSRPDTAVIVCGAFAETVGPANASAIEASLRRLISPVRLVWNLMGEGEKSALDRSPQGLSRWAESLAASRVHVVDRLWNGEPLPATLDAAVLAGPRAPLDEVRLAALLDYLARGGRLFIMQDPLTAGFDVEALAPLGLSMPPGLAVDPESAWSGA